MTTPRPTRPEETARRNLPRGTRVRWRWVGPRAHLYTGRIVSSAPLAGEMDIVYLVDNGKRVVRVNSCRIVEVLDD